MTSDRDPPRLRTLLAELPGDLLLALRAPGATPTPAEVAELAQRVRTATRPVLRPVVPRRPTVRGRAASLFFAFSLGAAAGVAVFSASLVIERARGSQLTKPAAPPASAQREPGVRREIPPPPSSATSEVARDAPLRPPPSDRVPPRLTDPARPPVPAIELELPSVAPTASHGANREELALLARAQSALDRNPAQALALTGEHERRFPHGALVQEREVVAIDALVRLGRRGEAAIRAVRFQREFRASVHGRRLDVLLGTGGGAARDHN